MSTFTKTKEVQTRRRHLRATGPGRFCVAGQMVPINGIVDVSLFDAAGLTHRGLAVDATPAEVTAAGESVIVGDSARGDWEDVA